MYACFEDLFKLVEFAACGFEGLAGLVTCRFHGRFGHMTGACFEGFALLDQCFEYFLAFDLGLGEGTETGQPNLLCGIHDLLGQLLF